MGTFIVSIILIAMVTAIVRKMIKDKKEGKSGCSCGCDSCPSSSICHDKK